MPGYTGAFGRVYHGDALLDEAVLFVYHAPHSYTGDVYKRQALQHGGVGRLGHLTAEGIQLPDEVPLGGAADAGVAGHIAMPRRPPYARLLPTLPRQHRQSGQQIPAVSM